MARPIDHFAADHLTADLRGRSVRGVAAMFAAHSGRIVIGIGSAAVLGRLLTPQDFGLVAMVTAVIALFDRVRTVGLGASVVQRTHVNHAQVSNLFWINSALGLVFSAIFAAAAPLIVWFYHKPELGPIAIALSLSFFASGITVQHAALMRRQMRYRNLALVELISEAFGATAGIAAALLGAGYWSLVILNLSAMIARFGATVALCRWIPGRPRRGAKVRGMLKFGSQVSTSAFLQSIVMRVDRILIGKFISADALGYYTRGVFLLIIPIQRFQASLRDVVVPGLSRIQDEPYRYRFFYRQAVQLITVLAMPGVFFAFAVAAPLVETVLGPQWTPSAPIIRALAPGALMVLLTPITGWVYYSLGRGGRLMRWTTLESIICLAAIIIGLHWGAVGVAAGFSIARVALWTPSISFCFAGTPVRWRDLSAVLWRPLLAAVLAMAVVMFDTHVWFATSQPAVMLIANAAIFSVTYGVATLALPGGIAAVRDMLALSRELKSAGS